MGFDSGNLDLQYRSSDGLIHYVTSSRRFKENIRDYKLKSEWIDKIEIKKFNYKKEYSSNQSTKIGIIAEDLFELTNSKKSVVYDKNGEILGLNKAQIKRIIINYNK